MQKVEDQKKASSSGKKVMPRSKTLEEEKLAVMKTSIKSKKKEGSASSSSDKKATSRSKTLESSELAVMKKSMKSKEVEASFNWEAMASNDEKPNKDKKNKEKEKKDTRKTKIDLSKKSRRESNVGKDGHFSWAFHASGKE